MKNFGFLGLFLLAAGTMAADSTIYKKLLDFDPATIKEVQQRKPEERKAILDWLVRFGTSDPEVLADKVVENYLPGRAARALEKLSLEAAVDATYLESVIKLGDTQRSIQAIDLLPATKERSGKILISYLNRHPGLKMEDVALNALRRMEFQVPLGDLQNYLKSYSLFPDELLFKFCCLVLKSDTAAARELVAELLAKETAPKRQTDIIGAIAYSPGAFSLWVGKLDKYIPQAISKDRYFEWLMRAAGQTQPPLTLIQKHQLITASIPLARERDNGSDFELLELIRSLGPEANKYIDFLSSRLYGKSETYHGVVIQLMEAMGTPESRETLKKYSYSPLKYSPPPFTHDLSYQLGLRARAVGALGKFADPTSVDYLSEQLKKMYRLYGAEGAKEIVRNGVGTKEQLADAYETVRGYLSTDAQRMALDRNLSGEIFKSTKANQITACQAICQVASKVESWAKQSMIDNPEDWQTKYYPAAPHSFALASLGALFLSKAAPLCPEAKVFTQELAKSLFAEDKSAKPPKVFQPLRRLAAQVLAMSEGQPPGEKYTVYGKGFYLALLQEMKKAPAELGLNAKEILAEEKSIRESLRKDLSHERPPTSMKKSSNSGNSNFETFTLGGTGLLLDSPPAELKANLLALLKTSVQSQPSLPIDEASQYLPYAPNQPAENSKRGSSARGVPFHLALYAREPANSPLKSNYRKNLLAALQNYTTHIDSMQLHIPRNTTHQPTGISNYDGLAPYYYYPATAFAASAFRLLDEDTEITKEQRDTLKKLEQESRSKLLLLLQDTGLFLSQGAERYPTGPAYNNPLAGLALLSFAKDCLDEKQPRVSGITDLATMQTPFAVPIAPATAKEKKPHPPTKTRTP